MTDEDFSKPTRNVEFPALPKNVNDAIGANGKPVIIKKNIFEKNKTSHKDLGIAKYHFEIAVENANFMFI